MEESSQGKQKMASGKLPEAIFLNGTGIGNGINSNHCQSLLGWPKTWPSLGVSAWANVWAEMDGNIIFTVPSNKEMLRPDTDMLWGNQGSQPVVAVVGPLTGWVWNTGPEVF
jgi:hypothetical protein